MGEKWATQVVGLLLGCVWVVCLWAAYEWGRVVSAHRREELETWKWVAKTTAVTSLVLLLFLVAIGFTLVPRVVALEEFKRDQLDFNVATAKQLVGAAEEMER